MRSLEDVRYTGTYLANLNITPLTIYVHGRTINGPVRHDVLLTERFQRLAFNCRKYTRKSHDNSSTK
jgi:hypothetical protein